MRLFESSKRLQTSLMTAFLVISMTPLTLSGFFFLNSHIADLESQSSQHLSLLRDTKAKQIEDYFLRQMQESLNFASSELANASGGKFYGLVGAFNQLAHQGISANTVAQSDYIKGVLTGNKVDLSEEGGRYIANERYRLLHKRYHEAYTHYLTRADFSNILLVDVDGNVAYSVEKAPYFGQNLLEAQFKELAISQTFVKIRDKVNAITPANARDSYVFTDYSIDPLTNENTAWFAAPIIQQGYLHSFVLYALPTKGLDGLLIDNTTDSLSISTLVFGEDSALRAHNLSFPFAMGSQIGDQTEYEVPIVNHPSVEKTASVNGEKVLSAARLVRVLGYDWTLLIELPENEAFSRITQLKQLFAIAMTVAFVLVVVVSHWLSNSITAPLLKLTWAAERVSAGDLDQDITSTDRPDEIGRLAISFARMQRSVREKLILIREKNNELEQSLEVIQQKNRELETADKLKDEFLATTSHELRTPLHGMIGIAESIQAGISGPVPDRHQHQLQMLITSAQRLSTLVDDLLDYHKMRYDNLVLNRHAVDLSAAVRLVLELSHHLLGDKPVRIINQIPHDLPLVSADEQRLEQVLYNLVGNAIKYTSEGKIVISATVLDTQLRIQVVDTGQGIPAQELEHIFEPLIQATADSSRYQQGTGLGLTISRQLIELMGGQLYVSSQPMVGSTFSFTLDIASGAQLSNMPASNKHFDAPLATYTNPVLEHIDENPDGELILVVDDEPINLQIVANYLRLAGYRVVTAEDGKQALTLIEQTLPALLLLDVMMPELNGYEVCQALRANPRTVNLPVIMLSALNQAQDRVKGFEAGASDYLNKPFNKEELIARIRAHLRAYLVQQEQEKNQALLNEIAHRERIEHDLLETQGKLLNLLESSAEAILCIQADGRIRYANHAAARLFQLPAEQLERHNLNQLLAEPIDTQALQATIYLQQNGELQSWPAAIQPMPEASGLDSMVIVGQVGPSSQYRMEMLEKAVSALSEYAFDGDRTNLQELRELGGEFTRLADKLNHDEKSKADLVRELTVEVMTHTLVFWEKQTGRTKFALAEESGLWRVYLDRSTLQTRTLDKYLHPDTLPKSPRWRNVMSTIDFVLERCQQPGPERQQLEGLRDKLAHLLQH
uniref:response regulator n=1 Tax=Thaumasiovibrio occultus TaxID=1891184 RepID=UPI000B351EF8|nr:response regulator [Thaumasiovibrio occultus]